MKIVGKRGARLNMVKAVFRNLYQIPVNRLRGWEQEGIPAEFLRCTIDKHRFLFANASAENHRNRWHLVETGLNAFLIF